MRRTFAEREAQRQERASASLATTPTRREKLMLECKRKPATQAVWLMFSEKPGKDSEVPQIVRDALKLPESREPMA